MALSMQMAGGEGVDMPRYLPFPNARQPRSIALDRLDGFTDGGQFSDINLHAQLYLDHISDERHVKLQYWQPDGLRRPAFEEAAKASYTKASKFQVFSPSWQTVWFKIALEIPKRWWGHDGVRFEMDCQGEGLIWTLEGEPIHGLTMGGGGDRRVEYLLDGNQHEHHFFIEVALNGMFGCAPGGNMIAPPDPNRTFQLVLADIVVINPLAWDLMLDFGTIKQLAKDLPKESLLQNQALKVATEIIRAFRRNDQASLKEGRRIAEKILGKGWAEKGAKVYNDDASDPRAHLVNAIGNCHIDTAWLWPFAETQRKVARSWSSQVYLADRYPEHRFVASQAQQFKWLETLYPKLFEKVKAHVQKGSFIPIGGSWVENDGNLPSGEAFCRQLIFGQRYFQSRFGKRSEIYWLPDTFGYSSQIPQIVRMADMKYFFTQKLSWNNINKYPNTTFAWCGLDNSMIITHMAPADTYVAQGTVEEVVNCVKDHKDLADAPESLLAFGNGDGGGGPLARMLESLRRIRAASNTVGGLPKIKVGDGALVTDLFHRIEANSHGGRDLVTWHGELYLELHRGCYTSHGYIKKYNRKTEILLREVEHFSTLASILPAQKGRPSFTFPRDEINPLWEDVLLNQFHDVLPGSAIEMVYDDAESMYEKVVAKGSSLIEKALQHLVPASTALKDDTIERPPRHSPTPKAVTGARELSGSRGEIVALNTTAWPRREVVKVPLTGLTPSAAQTIQGSFAQVTKDHTAGYAFFSDPIGNGVARSAPIHQVSSDYSPASIVQSKEDNSVVLRNGKLAVKLIDGQITSLVDIQLDRELIPKGFKGNNLVTFDDQPLYWDAWDVEIYHLEMRHEVGPGKMKILETGPLRASVEVEYRLGEKSWLKQVISLDATTMSLTSNDMPMIRFENEVEWRENRTFLKVEFPLDLYSDQALYETQFGYIKRPTHTNTMWDVAKFEVSAHKWADLSEANYGAAVLNDCKYGYATHGNLIRLSLLRSPKAPDAHTDMGRHTFSYALLPHRCHFTASDVVQRAYEFNTPMHARHVDTRALSLMKSLESPIHIRPALAIAGAKDRHSVILDTIKRGDDDDLQSGKRQTLIVRSYEAYGGHAKVDLVTSLDVKHAYLCNLLEDDETELTLVKAKESQELSISLSFKPFTVVSVKLVLA